jgi:spoIIIJ-associated protein
MIFNLFKSSAKGTHDDIDISNDMKEDAKTFIETILQKANFNSVVAINNDADSVLYLMIDDEYETARIIGKDGQTLQSFQVLLQSYLTKKYNQYIPVFVDCNEYFSYRIEKAQNKAKELEERLSSDRTSIELFPMTALERRAIHTLYKDNNRYTTYSVGEGEDRRIVLSLKDSE